MEHIQHFINGRMAPPKGGRYLDTYNPLTAQKVGETARGDADDVDAAVTAAKAALDGWRNRRPIERGRILLEISRRMRAELDKFVALERRETGKPVAPARRELEVAA